MTYWLIKTEPGAYSFADLLSDKRTRWDGVSNNLALKHMRAMRTGDGVFVYHSGSDKAIVGLAEIAGEPYADPGHPGTNRLVVDIAAVGQLPRPVSLAAMKNEPGFASFELIRISRLSVMPVPASIASRIFTMAGTTAGSFSKLQRIVTR